VACSHAKCVLYVFYVSLLYLRACTRLSSWCHPFDNDRAESFGGCIDRSRETCTDDRHIAGQFGIRQFGDTQFICQLRNGRAPHDPPVREYYFRQ
jgi:hypothetical protein